MRENKYRGFDPITKKFVYGNLLFTNETYYIIPFLTNGCMSQKEMMLRWISPCNQVIPETIGQFTGLHDKNGVEIYEGDILHLHGKDTINEYDWKAVVEFGNPNGLYSWGYQLNPITEFGYNADILAWIEMEECGIYAEVIGNIHESEDK